MNKKNKTGIFFLFVLVSFSIRFYGLAETGMQNDEQLWQGRGGLFVKSLLGPFGPRDFNPEPPAWNNETKNFVSIGMNKEWPLNIMARAKHPGIPASFVIGLGYLLLAEYSCAWSLNLFPLYVAARIPIVILSTAFIGIFFVLLLRLINWQTALFAAIILALEPSYVGYTRLARNDALTGMLATLALILFLYDWYWPSLKHKITASLFFALSVLGNPYPVFILPVILFLHLLKKTRKSVLNSHLWWYLLLIPSMYIVFYPNLWNNPLLGIWHAIQLNINTPHFQGEQSFLPASWLIYTVYPFFHFSILFSIGIFTGAFVLFKQLQRAYRRNCLGSDDILKVIGIFLLWYVLSIFILCLPAGRKSYKNVMIFLPALSMLAGNGLYAIGHLLKGKRRFVHQMVLPAVYIIQCLLLLVYWFPYYQLHYLTFFTGDPVHWGKYKERIATSEGKREAAEFIRQNGGENQKVFNWADTNNFLNFYRGPIFYPNGKDDVSIAKSCDWFIVGTKRYYCVPPIEKYPLTKLAHELIPYKIIRHKELELVRLYKLSND